MMKRAARMTRLTRSGGLLLVALAGVATALVVGMAVAKTFVLQDASNATVDKAGSNVAVREAIVVGANGRAVYTLSGDSPKHPECTAANQCLKIWPPITTRSRHPAVAPGVEGKVGIWHRNGFTQLTLGGHPLYRFSFDKRRDAATGQDLHSFGGTWHIVKALAAEPTSSTTTTTTLPAYTAPSNTTPTTPTTTTPTTTTPIKYPYPPPD